MAAVRWRAAIGSLAAFMLLWLHAAIVMAQPSDLLDQARLAIAAGRLEDADRLLGAVDEAGPDLDRNDLDFLRGTLCFARQDYQGAIDRFRAILLRDPAIVRVRLDLARALFFQGDFEAAAYHFHLAEASGLPPEVQVNVNGFLGQIRRKRHWTLDLSAGVAPDSNVNAATVVKTVTLLGLPFQLDQSAQKASGVGFAGNAGGSYQVDLSDDSRLVIGGSASDLDYQGNQYDDRAVGAYIGPRFLLGADSEISVRAEASRRWYGGLGYSKAVGGRIDADSAIGARFLWSGWLDVEQMTYDQLTLNSGPVGSIGSALTYGIDQLSFVRLDASVLREQTEDAGFRDTQYMAGPSYYRDMPLGFGVLLGFSADLARYDQALAIFGVTRRDLTASYRLGLSNKQLSLFGMSPVITLTHTNRWSDISLYSYERDRAEISITRNF